MKTLLLSLTFATIAHGATYDQIHGLVQTAKSQWEAGQETAACYTLGRYRQAREEAVVGDPFSRRNLASVASAEGPVIAHCEQKESLSSSEGGAVLARMELIFRLESR